MPFWGIEVKPGKSYAYPGVSARIKLRITQASIGAGKSTARSTLQVNVGDNKPVILCNLLPNICENFSMDLEFEESETVTFSVIGERSVHLAGYHVKSLESNLDGNDSDSIGEDICQTESSSESDDHCSDLDRYESDFIDDDDDDITDSPSPTYTIKERKEPSCLNASSRLKKGHQVNDYKPFDETKPTSIFNLESDDSHDSMLLSTIRKKKGNEKKKSNAKVSSNTDNPTSIFNLESDDSHDSSLLSTIRKKKENEKKKSNAKVSLNTDNPRLVAVDAKEKTSVSRSKKAKVGQESNEKTEKKKKKTKKVKEEKGVDAVATPRLEKDGSAADKNAHGETDKLNDANKQKETSDKVNAGVEENQKKEASGHDGTGKKKKAKMPKETCAVNSADTIDDKHHVSKVVHSENDGGSKKKRKAKKHGETTGPTDSEVSVLPSDTAQHTPIKGGKKSKRSKDERPCDSEVDAKKLKKGDAVDEDTK